MTDLSQRIAALTPEQRAVFERLRKKQRKAGPPEPEPIALRSPGDEPLPLSFDQERLWFLYHLDPEASAYNIDNTTRMKGPLRIPALQAALNEVVRRHESWRTTFPAVLGQPVQVIAPSLTIPLPVIDLSGLPEPLREPLALQLSVEEFRDPFDLAAGPLVRARLLRVAPEDCFCILTVHHIVTDWVSFQIFWRELATLYVAFCEGRPSPLAPLAIQYADFALWQRRWLAGETLQRYVDFWLEELEGAPQFLELPTDRPRPPAQTTRGRASYISVSAEVAERLRAVSRKEGATPFMGVLAAFSALLARWSGQDTVLVGSPNANRNRVEIEPVLGFFLTQLVFATDLSGDPTFRELLHRERGTALRAYEHQDLPFGKLVEALRPERDPSRAPLVQVNLLLLDAEATVMKLPSLTIEPLNLDDGVSRFDLTFSLWEGAGGIHGWIEYNTDLFDHTTILRTSDAFETLIARVGETPDVRLSDLPLMSEAARQQTLVEWQGETAEPGPCVDRLFEAQAAAIPESTALLAGDLAVTYAELNRRANRLAHHLLRLGVGPEARVGLCLDRSPELVAGMLGVWKAGAAYVALDPAYPRERLDLVMDDAGIDLVVARAGLPGGPRGGVREVDFDGPGALAGEPEENPGRSGRPGDLAYVLYTSGTTGRPKGVMVEHGNLASTLAASRRAFGWNACDRIPSLAPASFDIFLFELLNPLLAGGLCELVPISPTLDLPRLLAALPRATRLHAVPALMRQLVGLVSSSPPCYPYLRTLFVGGDAVPTDLLADLRAAFPGAEVRVLYGPTEGTIICSSLWADGSERPGALLGRPLPGALLRLRDFHGGLPLMGARGEVWIGGGGVTRGYLGRDDLTAERYVTAEGRRWFRTGDLARWLPDGTLEFLGRADQQVKVRGFRIEPGEIEAVLAAHPSVRAAAVLARPVEGGDKRLVAYVAADAANGEVLRSFLAGRLPEHMVPGAIVVLPELPLTPHGKVDRKALLSLDPAGGEAPLAGEATPPRTPTEEALAGIWRGVLGMAPGDRLGIHDNFFRLGGDSILSIQVVARAREAGLLLTPRQLFENQTIAGLAAVAGAASGTAAVADAEEEISGEAPLAPVQRQFFAADPPEPHHFNQALLLEARQPLDPGLLTEALAALARHHDALRLTFQREGDTWRQVYGPADLVPACLAVDLSGLAAELRGGAVEEACARLQTGFDLARGPLFLAALFDFGGGGGPGRLFLAAHHLIVDGVSWRILLEDLATAYGQLAEGGLPARTTSWKRWAERLAEHARSAAVREELGYWRSAAMAVRLLPLEVSRTSTDTVGSAGRVSAALSPEVTATLLRVAPAAYRTQVNDLLLTALAQAFGRWTGESVLYVDLEGHGREEVVPGVDLSRTVGWFTAVFPVVLDITGITGITGVEETGAAIKAVKEQLRRVPSRGIGHGLLRFLSGGEDLLAGLPVPEVGFNYLGQVDGALEGGLFAPAAEGVGPTESPRARRRHRIEIDAMVLEGSLRIDLGYSGGALAPETAERLARGFAAALEGVAGHCAARVERAGIAGGDSSAVPSDFPLARLSQAGLDALLKAVPEDDLEDLYPLAPLQGGLLFHSLYEPDSELYFEQLACSLHGPLDVDAFARAWQGVVDRHPALRTAFLWEGLDRPLQAVRRQAEVPWVLEDWRGVPEGEIEGRLARMAAVDRALGFDLGDLGQAPLLRLALVRTGEAEHRLLWSFHHLLFDGWCFSLIFGEVLALYEAARTGREIPLPPVRPYRDYIAWLERQDGEAEEAWWRRRLAGFAAATSLPADRPGERAGSRAADYGELDLRLAPEIAEGLTALAQRLEVTVNNLAQGAWAVLLARFSGERDVAFGTVVSGRPAELPGVESIVGLFINTLPVRLSVDPEAGLADWLRSLRQAQQDLSQHGWNPLSRVQGWSEVPPGEPLFESLFVFENYPLDPSLGDRLADLSIGEVAVSEGTSYPLTITAVSRGDFVLRAGFDRRFDRVTAQRLLGHLESLLGGLVRHPQGRLGGLPLLSAAERHQLLAEWNDTAALDPSETPVHERFSAVAAERPDAPALVWDGRRVSYGDLDRASNRLARHLLGRGADAEPEERIGLLLERSAGMVEAILGVFKAGAAYVPLDPAYPAERLALIAGDAGVRRVLTLERFAARVPEGCEAVLLDRHREGGSEAAVASSADLDSLAYVMYTSGSTGRPKGVAAVHRGIARLADEDYGVPADPGGEVVLHVSPVAFDASTFEIWSALLRGGTVAIVPAGTPSLDQIGAAVAGHGVTSAFLTTSLFHLLADERPQALAPLRRLLVGGEALSPAHARRFLEKVPGPRFSNIYGPTENTTFSAYQPVDLWSGEGAVPLGRPLVHRRLRVLGDGLDLLPVGAVGELCVGGDGLARGYHGRPDLTAASFVPDPEAVRPGERLYRTGDRARLRPDGGVDFLGRFDGQVKIRGFRIEPGEIEAALAAHPAVREAAVVVRSGDRGEKRLAGYVSCAPVAGTVAAELRVWLEQRLPAYMVPADLTVLDRLPLNAHGKVDRAALPAPEAPREAAAGFVAPRTPAEETLAAVWRGVLGVERVGVHDNFFHLGGDSILSIQVVARARQAGLAVTPKQVFEEQTVAALAAVAQALTGPEGQDEQGPVEGEAPLTPIQRWFLADAVEPHWFNQSVLLEVREPLAPAQLAEAVAALALHHDALRLLFLQEEGAWRQAHAPASASAASAPLLLADLAALPEGALGRAVEEASAALQTAFDLERGPLFLAALFERGSSRPDRLLLAAHHLVVDGVSWRILLEDLETACGQLAAGQPVALPAKTTSWKRWAESLARLAGSPAARADLGYWLALADRGAALPLPVDRPADFGTVGEAAAVSAALSETATASLLREAPEAYRTQVNDLLLAALARAFARWQGSPEASHLWLDLEGHGREDAGLPGTDLSRTVGWFTSVFPVVLDLDEGADPGTSIKGVKESLRSVPRHGLGFGLLRWLGDPDDAGAALLAALPAPEVAFNYLGQLDRTLGAEARWRPAPEAMGPGQSPRSRMRHRIEINAWVLGGRLETTWAYGTGAYEAATLERLASGFLAALEELIAHCTAPGAGGLTPSDFPLAALDAGTLDGISARLGGPRAIEDVYPISPLQGGMLFHNLYAPGSELYHEQLSFAVRGPLDKAVLRRAWQTVVDRHPALRTAFVWEDVPQPLQVVVRAGRLELPWEEEDWRQVPAAELTERLRRWRAADRARRLDPGQAPLMRATLLRTGEAEYRFAWTFHHLLLDGWCFSLVLREVFVLYEAAVSGTGREVSLPPVRPYRDFLAWLVRQNPTAAERFWRSALAGFAEPNRLPFDTPGTPAAVAGTEGEPQEELLALPGALVRGLSELAQRRELTLNTVVQGAWALLLSRYTGDRDVVFGTVVSGRPADLPGVETAVGLFINTLPVRVDADPEAALSSWLRRLQERQVETRQHEHAPLAEVQRWSDVPPGAPLFESLLAFENYPVDESLGRDGTSALDLSEFQVTDRTDYPLSPAAIPSHGGRDLTLRVGFDRRFEAVTVRRMVCQLETLLAGFVAAPDGRLGSLSLLSAAERHQLTAEWGGTLPAEGGGVPVHRLFERQAVLRPGALAVPAGSGSLSYGDLLSQSRRLAAHLRERGAGPDVPVLLWMERSPEMVTAMLGILLAGGAYVPLDPDTPAERVARVLDDLRAASGGEALAVTSGGLAERLPAGVRAVCLDVERQEIASRPDVGFDGGDMPEGLAVIFYTSGSTGVPKGVAVSHRSLAAYVAAAGEAYGIGPEDRVLQFASLAFDASAEELFTALTRGAALPLRTGLAEEPSRFLARCREDGITVLGLPTAYWHQVSSAVEEEGLEIPPALRLVVVGGERVSPERWEAWGRLAPGVRLVNSYGPTEATIAGTLAERPAGEGGGVAAGREVPIGRPMAGGRAYVLGEELEPAPAGAAGELFLAGAGIARGYLGRPDLTAERFLPDPFGALLGEPGSRLYRTGDRARRFPDGTLELTGRTDAQVKIRGFRVEPGEIEAALAAQDGVRQAAVIPWKDAAGDLRLAAFVVPREGSSLPGPAALQGTLPAYMVPSSFVAVASLPLTLTGKVDRRALARRLTDGSAGIGAEERRSFVAPRNPVEVKLAALWADLLGVERVGAEDDFFALGGHSLSATRLASRLRRELGVELPLARLFELRRLEDLAREVIALQLAQEQDESLDALMADLEGMSDDEALALLDGAAKGEG